METKEQANQAANAKTPKDNHVDIFVQAKNLYQLPPTEFNVDMYTYLLDGDGNESLYGRSNQNYESEVYLGKKMTWNIKLADKLKVDKDYDVELVSISHNPTANNPNFFNADELYPRGNKKKIEGTISNSPILPDMDENYTIYFKIIYDGVAQHYPLDPKLKANG